MPTGNGLSPRVRGNQQEREQEINLVRSIPACAGEPPVASRMGATASVYPRVCGGTRSCPTSRGNTRGLSPRVRGNLAMPSLVSARPGSIPACAGEPRRQRLHRADPPVYPRVCGGTQQVSAMPRKEEGLSPRVRGNPLIPTATPAPTGSIPACAGEPLPDPDPDRQRRVYPRVCGGTDETIPPQFPGLGLSPRVRGNPYPTPTPTGSAGSIPACAGEPGPVPPLTAIWSVYPRVCGGTPPTACDMA